MSSKLKKWIVGLVGLSILVLVVLAFLPRSPGDPPGITIPDPNGYDDFVEAGRRASIGSNIPSLSENVETKELEALVANNQAPLQLLREGLAKESQVPLHYVASYETAHLKDLRALKNALRLLVLEGRLQEEKDQFGEASESYLSAVQYGHAVSNGGLIIDVLVGLAAQGVGIKSLDAVVQQLDVEQSRKALRSLSQIDQTRSFDPKTVIEREKRYFQEKERRGLQKKIFNPFEARMLKPVHDSFRGKVNKALANRRRLMVRLGAHLFELEKGTRPKAIGDLIPDYLSQMPIDPTTDTAIPLPLL